MRLESTEIYKSIEKYLKSIPIIKVKKGENVKGMSCVLGIRKFYIISGKIKVVNSIGARKIRIDNVETDQFIGEFDNVNYQYCNCDIIATENTLLLGFTDDVFDMLFEHTEFVKLFYYKTTKRMCELCKNKLAKDMYNSTEVVSSYIIKNTRGDKCICPSMNELSEMLGLCRTSLYNAFEILQEEGYLEKKAGDIYIRNWKGLEAQGGYVFGCE